MVQIVRARGVRKVYRNGGEVQALRGIDLDIPRGELLAIAGPSGSGKTTLLNCLSGLERIDGGEILVDGGQPGGARGQPADRVPGQEHGVVFQAFNLLPVLSAAENVELPLLLVGVRGRKARARALDTLDLVGLAERAGTGPTSSRVGSSSAWPWPARWCTARRSCGPTSPPETSTPNPPRRSWRS